MKNGSKIIIIIFILLAVLCYYGYRLLNGPSVSLKDKREIKLYVEDYLTKKYGYHDFIVNKIDYLYEGNSLFDYSDPKGYWVYFKSDIVSESWLTIRGLINNNFKVDTDYLIKDYYYPDKDGYEIYNTLDKMKPIDALNKSFTDELKNEFGIDGISVRINSSTLKIPDNYGRVPTLDEIKTDVSLYQILEFECSISDETINRNEFVTKLKTYLTNKYNCECEVSYNQDQSISVLLNYD